MRISDWSSDVCSSDLQRHGFDLRRDRTEAKAGAVRAGRDRTGERLLVDVAEIHHPVAAAAQQMAKRLQRGADEDARDVVLVLLIASDRIERQQRRVGLDQWHERMSGTGDAELAPARGNPGAVLLHLV